MNLIEAVKSNYRKAAVFSGRARPAEYWYFVLFYWVAAALIFALEWTLGLTTESIQTFGDETVYSIDAGFISFAWWVLNLIPGLAVAVRRLHDTDRSGWWILLLLIPVVGWIVLFVFLVSAGTRGPNRFGEDTIT